MWNNFVFIYWKCPVKNSDGISETLNLKIYWGSMPPDSLKFEIPFYSLWNQCPRMDEKTWSRRVWGGGGGGWGCILKIVFANGDTILAFDEGERLLFMYRTRSSSRSVCHAISWFGCHLGPAWHTLPRSRLFTFSRPWAGIYFVILVLRWNVDDFLFTTFLFIVFLAVFN